MPYKSECDDNEYKRLYEKYDNLLNKLSFGDIDSNNCCFGILCALFGFLVTTICIVVIIGSSSHWSIEKNIGNIQIEREALVYRLETQEEIGNELLYADIVEFNNKVFEFNCNHNNPWISWFCPEEYTYIEPIDYRRNE